MFASLSFRPQGESDLEWGRDYWGDSFPSVCLRMGLCVWDSDGLERWDGMSGITMDMLELAL